MGAIEIFQKKKGNKVHISFQIIVDEDQAPSAVSTIRRKLTAIDMNPQPTPHEAVPLIRTSIQQV